MIFQSSRIGQAFPWEKSPHHRFENDVQAVEVAGGYPSAGGVNLLKSMHRKIVTSPEVERIRPTKKGSACRGLLSVCSSYKTKLKRGNAIIIESRKMTS